MSDPDEQPRSAEPAPAEEIPPTEEMFPEEPILPEDFTPLGGTSRLPRARRRRAHRMLVLPGADERAAILSGLARRAFPSFEFFLFAFFTGVILGVGYLLDLKVNSQAIFLLGILLAPLLTPWVGMTLAGTTGSWRFFFMTLGVILVASLLVFLAGALAGLAGRLWLPHPSFFQADIRSHIWWLDLFIVALGAALLTISFIRSEQKPILPSMMLAYGLFMPICAAGFGLGIGENPIWQNGVQVFLLHLALATIVGGIVLINLRFKPLKANGYILSFLVWVGCLAALVSLTGLVTVIRDGIIATRRSAPTPTTALIIPSKTWTPTSTPTPSSTLTPSETPTASATLEPTPAYAVITAPQEFGGANIRSEPAGGIPLATLNNGITVQVLPEIQNVNGANWVRIRWGDVEGWVLTSVLTATTAAPPPTSTLTPIP
jgi:hypothetical protein